MKKTRIILRTALMLSSVVMIMTSCTKSSGSPSNQDQEGNNNGNEQQADEGIFFTIETTGETVKATFVPGATYIAPSNETTLYAYIRDAGGTNRGRVSISIVGKGTSTWNWGPTVLFTYTVPNPGGLNTVYSERYVKGVTYPFSPGEVSITGYGDQYKGYITGTFSLSNAGKSDKSNVSIKGRFKCKRTGDQ